MSGVWTLLCLLRSGCQNVGKWRTAVKNGAGLSHRPRRANLWHLPKSSSCPPLPPLAVVPFPTSPLGLTSPQKGQLSSSRDSKTRFGQGNVLRAEKHPVGAHSLVTTRSPFPSAGHCGTAPQTSRKKLSCFMVGRCNWALLPERLLKDHQPWVDFPDCILAS